MWRTISSCSGSAKICCAVQGRLSPMSPESSSFQLADVDRLHLLDLVIGVEARRPQHLRLGIGRRELVGIEQERLHAVVPFRNRAQHALHRAAVGDVAAGEHRQRAEADRAAQDLPAVDLLDQLAVLVQHALVDALARTEDRWRRRSDRHAQPPGRRRRAGRSSSTTGPPVIIAASVFGTSSASAT